MLAEKKNAILGAIKRVAQEEKQNMIVLPLDELGERVQGVDNFAVESFQKQGDFLKVTVSFTIKDGEKVPRDAE
ncbi:MAG: hypothetical protein J7621_26545 [Niastella sp.]|nr:hypothetical protein [Niastella sp.]